MSTRAAALEAVAEAPTDRLVAACRVLLSEAGAHRIHAHWSVFLAFKQIGEALATLDALPTTPAAAAPPTDEELFRIEDAEEQRWRADGGGNFSVRVRRALYTRGTQDGRAAMLAEVVARLRERAAEHRAEAHRSTGSGRIAESNKADALEAAAKEMG